MTRSILALSAFAFLAGCPDESLVYPAPPPEPAPVKLLEGDYSVLIIGIAELDCDGLRGRDLVGMKLPLSLEIEGHALFGDLAGFQLEGERHGGVLSLVGSQSPELVVMEEDADDEADVDSSTEPVGEDDEDGEDSGGSSGGSGGGSAEPPDDDEPVVVPVEEEELALELVTRTADHADGTLAFRAGTCSFTVPVVADRIVGGGDDPKPVPVEEEEPVEPPCDEADDCG